MTEEELTAIEARAAAATAGPWVASHRYNICWDVDGPDANGPDMMPKGDAQFIAAARVDVPALVAEVRRLRAEVGAVYGHDYANASRTYPGPYPRPMCQPIEWHLAIAANAAEKLVVNAAESLDNPKRMLREDV